MSAKSQARNVKLPTTNARREIKKSLAGRAAKVTDSGTGETVEKTIPFNLEPGHRDLGLIRPKFSGIRMDPEKPATKGAFGGVAKALRLAKREADALHRQMALSA